MSSPDEQWFLRPVRRENAHIKLFCFPYAGGTPNIFRSWAKELPDTIEVVAVRLPGRDNRLREPAFSDWTELLTATEAALSAHLDRPFAYFGHSFGARVAFELTRRLEARQATTPAHLLLSGCRCPHVPPPDPLLHAVPREEFFRRVRKMKGTPSAVLHNQRLMEMLEPTLRADMKLHNERWEVSEPQTSVPIAALSGELDEIDPPESMHDWGRYTRGALSFHSFSGDHFFLHTHEDDVLSTISRILVQTSPGERHG